jgi:mannosyltransferase OCH1-like enzyme
MRNTVGGKIYEAYSRLSTTVMKADLWRYCVIYYYGGIYADADTICKVNPKVFTHLNTCLVMVPENSTHLCQWIFSAPKYSPILRKVIELSVNRILKLNVNDFKNSHFVHYLTGPAVFTQGVEDYLVENGMNTFKDKTKYSKIHNTSITVFNDKVFHAKHVIHLFTGQDKDGWVKQSTEENFNKMFTK